MHRYRVNFLSIDYDVSVVLLLDAKSHRGAFQQFFDGLGVRWGTKVSLGVWDEILDLPFTLMIKKLR